MSETAEERNPTRGSPPRVWKGRAHGAPFSFLFLIASIKSSIAFGMHSPPIAPRPVGEDVFLLGERGDDVALAQPPGAQTLQHAVDLIAHGLDLRRRGVQHRAHCPEKDDEMPVAELRRALAARVVL